MLIIVSGLPGTGKSAIADGLGLAIGAPVLSVDPIESAILRAGIRPTFETGLAAYLIAETLADRHLAAGLDVVIDAVTSVDVARDWWRALAQKHGVPLNVIVCLVSDERVHRERLAVRRRDLAFAETTWDAVQARAAEWTDWPEPHLKLDGMDPLDENLKKALAFAL